MRLSFLLRGVGSSCQIWQPHGPNQTESTPTGPVMFESPRFPHFGAYSEEVNEFSTKIQYAFNPHGSLAHQNSDRWIKSEACMPSTSHLPPHV